MADLSAAAAWQQVCRAYFFEQDVDAQTILHVFDTAVIEHSTGGTNSADNGGSLTDGVKLRLNDLGFAFQQDGAKWRLPEALLQEYSLTKSAVRREYHEAQQKRSEERLKECLLKYTKAADGDAGAKKVTASQLYRAAKRFSAAYQRSISTHPFLAGLHKLLTCQLQRSATTWQWTVDRAVFIEGGGSSSGCGGGGGGAAAEDADPFMAEALQLLASMLRRVDAPADAVEVGGDASAAATTWEVEPWLSDRTLRAALRALPPPSRLQALPSGAFAEGGTARTNVDGKLDAADGWLSDVCPGLCAVS
ncbi:hypothetical protein JKP88DRAFT_334198 [Tribonema minus]|uniref:Uncharacterized protein n=1 Tax=Tribonema minus TaxID=303371 RepID=A0A836C9N5_9STRA|nr:hypothetical protein JKP88DRAFT_334198 [Tribonema minus]